MGTLIRRIEEWLEGCRSNRSLLKHILRNQEKIMADFTVLTNATNKLDTDVKALIASQASVQPAIDAAAAVVQAIDDQVVAATPAPPTV